MNPRSVIRPRSYFVGAAALVLAGLVVGLGLSAGLNLQKPSTAARAELASASVSASASSLESPFVSVVEKTLPAVVFINVQKKSGSDGDPSDDFMRRWLGDVGPRRPQRTPSSGSGFIIDDKGHILTNNHVVRDADDISVTLNDKRTFKAKVVGTDPSTDVAVIQIEGDHLPMIPLGDSDRLRVGDWAIAIGNPLGELRGSVTVGIVSAQGRSNLNIFGSNDLQFQDFIQTDASINFGNSGGPLCNIHGEAIGINTAVNTSGQGIGFAIPINLVKHVADQLMANGKVKRAMIGIQLAELTPEVAEGFGLSGSDGAVVQSVFRDSPAERAGIMRNDVIVEFDGQPVKDRDKFRLKVADTAVGRKVPLVVLRDGKRIPLTVTLTDRDDRLMAGPGRDVPTPQAEATLGGLTVRELTADEKAQMNLETGVKITAIEDDSIAESAGLEVGDVIEQVTRRPITTAAEFSAAMKAAKTQGRPAVLLVTTKEGQQRFVPIRLK